MCFFNFNLFDMKKTKILKLYNSLKYIDSFNYLILPFLIFISKDIILVYKMFVVF